MQDKCEKRKTKDLQALDEESKNNSFINVICCLAKEYEENVKKEFVYFEFINVLRIHSRRVMVRTNFDT